MAQHEPQPPDSPPEFPLALKVVATSFIVFGLFGLVDIAISALDGHLSVDLNVVGLLIGRGLWRLNSTARWWAIFAIWLFLVTVPIAIIIVCVAAICGPWGCWP